MAQEKVTLRDTEIGVLVKRRLARPNIDKSAELRRFIELGFAAERAGFILDGSVLRHAGQAWHTQPDLGDGVVRTVAAMPAEPAVAEFPVDGHPAGSSPPGLRDRPVSAGLTSVEEVNSRSAPPASAGLTSRLRKLSGA